MWARGPGPAYPSPRWAGNEFLTYRNIGKGIWYGNQILLFDPAQMTCAGYTPRLDTGRDRDVHPWQMVGLNGLRSRDPGGSRLSLTYQWDQVAGR